METVEKPRQTILLIYILTVLNIPIMYNNIIKNISSEYTNIAVSIATYN